jgi:SAM-dependent methyltransferase
MVVYVDASQGMIDKARRNSPQNLPVRFIHGTEDNLPGDLVADVIITNCYLDLFSTTSLKRNISILVERLRPGGRWLVTDFVSTPQLYQKVLLKLMYTFFRLTTGIEATTLPQWERGLHEAGLVKEEVSDFYQGFIRSCLYIKPRPA